MKLLIILGNSAVGKMTVGQELTKITSFRLFHNHLTIEPMLEVFGDETFSSGIVAKMRELVFTEFIKTKQYGLIFTYMFDFSLQSEWNYIAHVSDIFTNAGGEVYYVELVTSQQIRLERNVSENRLANKKSKRDIETSNARLIAGDVKYRCESYDGEVPFENYIKIDNSKLSAQQTAKLIKEHFNL